MHIHWLKNHHFNFTDIVSGKSVYEAECRCGLHFNVDTLFPMPLFKVEIERYRNYQAIHSRANRHTNDI